MPVLRRAEALRALVATRRGHRGRGEPRQDDDVVDARARAARRGLAAELRDRRRGQRGRHQRRVRRRRVARRRGRRERRHVPRALDRGGDRHERRARPPRPLRRLRAARRRRSSEFLARCPGRRVVGADDPVRGDGSRRRVRRRRHLRLGRGRRLPRHRLRRPAATAAASRSQPTASGRRRPSSSPSRAGTTRRTRRRRRRSRSSSACRSTAVAEALRGFGGVARRFQFRGEVDGVTFVDDYAHLPGEVAGHDPGRPRRRLAPRRRGVPAAPLHPDRPALARLRRRVRRGRRGRAHRRVRGGGDADPGVSGRLVLHAVLDAHPIAAGRLPSRAGPSSWRTRCAGPVPATWC